MNAVLNHKAGLLGMALAVFAVAAAAQEALRAESFAESIPLTAEPGHPVQQLLLPDAVYRLAVSPEQRDVALFDAAGVTVPFVYCPVPPQQSALETRTALPVFPVRLARPNGQAATAEVSTESGNRIAITVPGGDAATPAVAVTAYDLDLSALAAPAVALQVQWQSPTGLSEVHVKVEQSEGAQQWQPVVPDAVLKRLTADGQTLEIAEIALPPARYQSLRLTPRDADGTLIAAVEVRTRSLTTAAADLHWFTARMIPSAALASAEASTAALPPVSQPYDAEHQAPVVAARVLLTAPNTRYAMRLMSRSQPQAAWQTVWTGEAFYLVTPDGERRSEDIALPPNRDRYWQLVADAGSPPITARLQLGYAPQNLRFIAQGQGPYRLAYGRADTKGAGPSGSCDSLLKALFDELGKPGAMTGANPASPDTDLRAVTERMANIGTAEAGAPQVLAGTAALVPAVPISPPAWRRWLLWAVLGLAVLLLLGMARGLLADLNKPSY